MNTIKLKKINLLKVLMLNIVLFSILSYEIHIYNKMYSIFNMLTLISSFILILLATTSKKNKIREFIYSIKINMTTVFLILLLTINTMMSSLTVGYLTFSSLVGVISVIGSILALYIFIPHIANEYIESIVKLIIGLITFCSIIGIIIGVKNSFFIYSLDGMRSASIFFDSNYFASLAAIAFFLSVKDKTNIGYLAGFINFLAIYFTGSRTAILGIILVLFFSSLYYKKVSLKKIVLLIFVISASYFGIEYLYELGYFRISQGLTGRESLWSVSIDYILREPIWGYGYGQVRRVLQEGGIFTASSSHNYFLDYALMFGIPALLVNLLVIGIGVFRGLRNNTPPYIMHVVIFLLLSMNSIVISLGGVGATSLIFTLFLGISNNNKFFNKKLKEGGKYYDEHFIQSE